MSLGVGSERPVSAACSSGCEVLSYGPTVEGEPSLCTHRASRSRDSPERWGNVVHSLVTLCYLLRQALLYPPEHHVAYPRRAHSPKT